jgi:hypothetical protein
MLKATVYLLLKPKKRRPIYNIILIRIVWLNTIFAISKWG